MAEGSQELPKTPQVAVDNPTPQESDGALATAIITPAKGKGLFGFLGGILGGKKQEPVIQPQESEEDIRSKMAKLQARRESVKAATQYGDATGSSKILDVNTIDDINKQLAGLEAQLGQDESADKIVQEPEGVLESESAPEISDSGPTESPHLEPTPHPLPTPPEPGHTPIKPTPTEKPDLTTFLKPRRTPTPTETEQPTPIKTATPTTSEIKDEAA